MTTGDRQTLVRIILVYKLLLLQSVMVGFGLGPGLKYKIFGTGLEAKVLGLAARGLGLAVPGLVPCWPC